MPAIRSRSAIRRIFCERGYLLIPTVGQVVYEKFLEGTGDRTKPSWLLPPALKFNRTVCRALFDREEIEGHPNMPY